MASGAVTKSTAIAQAISPSRDSRIIKIHILIDVVSRPFALKLMPGHVSDITVAPELLQRAQRARYGITVRSRAPRRRGFETERLCEIQPAPDSDDRTVAGRR